MKIQGAKKVHYDSGPNMTPPVDVVMVILIFLMLAGSFAGADHFLVTQAAYSRTGAGGAPPPPGGIPQDEPLEIRVDSPTPDRFHARFGQVSIDNNPQQLATQLATMRDKLGDVPVIISPGRMVKYKFLIDVYQSALQAKFSKISFATAR